MSHYLLIAVVGVLIVVQNGDFIIVCFPLLERLLLVSLALSASGHFLGLCNIGIGLNNFNM
jgi:hypothetical protein